MFVVKTGVTLKPPRTLGVDKYPLVIRARKISLQLEALFVLVPDWAKSVWFLGKIWPLSFAAIKRTSARPLPCLTSTPCLALFNAPLIAGTASPASIPIILITTKSSTRVKELAFNFFRFWKIFLIEVTSSNLHAMSNRHEHL